MSGHVGQIIVPNHNNYSVVQCPLGGISFGDITIEKCIYIKSDVGVASK